LSTLNKEIEKHIKKLINPLKEEEELLDTQSETHKRKR
jgi:hypothetical protein